MNKRHYFYSLTLMLLLVVVVAGWFATDYLGNKARQEIIEESRASALTLSIYVSSTMNKFEEAVKSLAGSPWIAPALLSKLSKGEQDIEHANSALDRYNSAFNASVSYLMDAEGVTVASSNRNDPDSFVGKSYRFRPYFQEAIKGNASRYYALGVTSGKRGFYVGYPVQNRLGKVVGVVTIKKDLDEIEAFFSKYPFCFFINPDGIIFLSNPPKMALKSLWPLDKAAQEKLIASQQFGNKPFEAVFLKKEIADGMEITLKGKDYLVSRKVIESSGWSIVLLTPTDLISAYKLIGVLTTISVGLLILFFSGIIYATDRSKEAIRQSEESKRLLLQAAGDGILVVDTTGQLTFINPAALRMLGFAAEEMLNKKVHDLIHHSHADGSIYIVEDCPMYASYTKAADSHVMHEVLWRKDGSSFPVEYSSMPITKNGKIIGAVVTFKDITERKRMEERLQKSERRFRGLVEQAAVGVAEIVMATGQFITVNNRLCEMVGRTEEELMATTFQAITHQEDLHLHEGKTQMMLAGEIGHYSLEKRYLRKDGEIIWVNITVSPLWKPGEPPGRNMIVVENITDRKRMEEEILALSITDQLTGLHNRRGFLSLAGQQLKIAKRNKNGMLLFFADLDGLKWINDTLGHEEGDKALIEAATVFKETFRTSDIIARLGGDEYATLAIDMTDSNSEIFTVRLQSLIDTRNHQENRRYRLSISVGSSYFDPENPCSLDELMAHADQLMYEQKQKKKGTLLQDASLSNGIQ